MAVFGLLGRGLMSLAGRGGVKFTETGASRAGFSVGARTLEGATPSLSNLVSHTPQTFSLVPETGSLFTRAVGRAGTGLQNRAAVRAMGIEAYSSVTGARMAWSMKHPLIAGAVVTAAWDPAMKLLGFGGSGDDKASGAATADPATVARHAQIAAAVGMTPEQLTEAGVSPEALLQIPPEELVKNGVPPELAYPASAPAPASGSAPADPSQAAGAPPVDPSVAADPGAAQDAAEIQAMGLEATPELMAAMNEGQAAAEGYAQSMGVGGNPQDLEALRKQGASYAASSMPGYTIPG